MANQTAGNPLYYDDTTGASWTGTKLVKEIDWIDDAGDVTHDSTLTILVNGVTIAMTVQPVIDDLGMGAVIAKFGPFIPAIHMSDVTFTISQGAVLVWLQ